MRVSTALNRLLRLPGARVVDVWFCAEGWSSRWRCAAGERRALAADRWSGSAHDARRGAGATSISARAAV